MRVLISGVSLLHFKPAKDRGRDTDYRDTDTETETERGGGWGGTIRHTGAMHVLISGVSLLHFEPSKDRATEWIRLRDGNRVAVFLLLFYIV